MIYMLYMARVRGWFIAMCVRHPPPLRQAKFINSLWANRNRRTRRADRIALYFSPSSPGAELFFSTIQMVKMATPSMP